MKSHFALALAALALGLAVTPLAHATQWRAAVGAQNSDMGHQAMAFLPAEIWIHAGDSITWNFASAEVHTLSLLAPGSVRPPFFIGCPPGPPPGVTPTGSSFTGTNCVNTGPMVGGTYTVRFPTAGNYKVVCLFHEGMTGIVHVLPTTRSLPHTQAFYDGQATRERSNLLAVGDTDGDVDRLLVTSSTGYGHQVIAGAGKIVATPGGQSTLSIMRFMHPTIHVHVGGTVEWGNDDPVTPHTITFGTEPADDVAPSPNVTVDRDGAGHATISSPADNVHSGLILASALERPGTPQAAVGNTRFRVTFKHAGVYPYICALHDDLGMEGTVIVDP
jgi:plastocyanin